MKRKLVLVLLGLLSSQLFAQHFYLGGGYNISYSRLKGINLFIDAYNADPSKIGGWTFDKPMDNLHFINGGCLSASIEYQGFIADITWVRRQASTYANYEIPSHDERWLGYKAGSLGFGLSTKMLEIKDFSFYPGLSLDFSKMKARTYLVSTGKDAWKNVDSSGNFGFNFSTTILYKPSSTLPIVFSVRPYYQMNFGRMSVEGLSTTMPDNYTEDISKLKVSGGNIGIMFQVLIDVFAAKDIKIKLPEKKPKPVEIQNLVIKGKVYDISSGLPVDAVITFYIDNKPSSSFITVDGNYTLNSAQFVTYTVETKAFGYQNKTETLTVSTSSENPLIHDIVMTKIPMGQAMKLENILFKKASAEMLPESYPELDKLYNFLKSNPTIEIEVSGHTSSEGNDDYNMKLSQDRANAITTYLVMKGINKSRITAKGYGETKAVATNDNEEGRKLNRRVEFKITKQ